MPMNPWDRKAELVRRRVKQSDIARRLGVSRAYVSDVIAGNRRSERVEAAVADAIGRAPEKVFPPREADRADAADAPVAVSA